MSRSKKTRKINPHGPRMANRVKQGPDEGRERKKKAKRKGLQTGSRHSQAEVKKPTSGQGKKDPKLGSKKPIVLVPQAETEVTFSRMQPKAKLAKALQPQTEQTPAEKLQPVKPEELKPKELTAEQELAQIEQDEKLSQLLDLVDEGLELDEAQQTYVETQMDRHQALMEQLGLIEEDESDDLYQQLEGIDTDWMSELKDKE